MLGVLKYQLPPTAITSNKSQQPSLLFVCATSWGDGTEANEHLKNLSARCQSAKFFPVFYFLEAVIMLSHSAGEKFIYFLRIPEVKGQYIRAHPFPMHFKGSSLLVS